MASTRPQSSAVAASMVVPVRHIRAACWRPMRRGTLTVPPAPGMSPMETSGRENVAESVASRLPAKAANSTPAPTAGPCTRTVRRSASRSSQGAALADDRIRCAATGSATVPNSAGSPPQQNADPLPASRTLTAVARRRQRA